MIDSNNDKKYTAYGDDIFFSSLGSVETPPVKGHELQGKAQKGLVMSSNEDPDSSSSVNTYGLKKSRFISPLKQEISRVSQRQRLEISKRESKIYKPQLARTPVSSYTNKERKLDFQIKSLQRQISIARQAQKYQASTTDHALQVQTEEWRRAGQMASNYLLNVAGIQITRQGGLPAFLTRQRERILQQISSYRDELPEFEDHFPELGAAGGIDTLSPDERACFEELRAEYEEAAEQRVRDMEAAVLREYGDGAGDVPPELDMKHLYMLMKLDPKILYPKGFDHAIT
jgi:hypothetical protein